MTDQKVIPRARSHVAYPSTGIWTCSDVPLPVGLLICI